MATTKTLQLEVKDGMSKEGKKYTYLLISDGEGTQIAREFIKATEFAYFQEVVGKYELVKPGV